MFYTVFPLIINSEAELTEGADSLTMISIRTTRLYENQNEATYVNVASWVMVRRHGYRVWREFFPMTYRS